MVKYHPIMVVTTIVDNWENLYTTYDIRHFLIKIFSDDSDNDKVSRLWGIDL